MHQSLVLVVIFDGQCRFCAASLAWLQKKLDITALPFQSTDVTQYGLTQEQCSKEVIATAHGVTYAGASAIAFLLHQRGNKIAAALINKSGRLGHMGYRWVASHRNSWLMRMVTRILEMASRP
jgi:predicted DCC family thiol-disulfide oxidoreductase YuxK